MVPLHLARRQHQPESKSELELNQELELQPEPQDKIPNIIDTRNLDFTQFNVYFNDFTINLGTGANTSANTKASNDAEETSLFDFEWFIGTVMWFQATTAASY